MCLISDPGLEPGSGTRSGPSKGPSADRAKTEPTPTEAPQQEEPAETQGKPGWNKDYEYDSGFFMAAILGTSSF